MAASVDCRRPAIRMAVMAQTMTLHRFRQKAWPLLSSCIFVQGRDSTCLISDQEKHLLYGCTLQGRPIEYRIFRPSISEDVHDSVVHRPGGLVAGMLHVENVVRKVA